MRMEKEACLAQIRIAQWFRRWKRRIMSRFFRSIGLFDATLYLEHKFLKSKN